MADPSVVQDSKDDFSETLDSPSSNLIYPEIDLNVSLETLLSHSAVPSPSASNIMEQEHHPHPHQPHQPSSLTESWASLSDISFDDDRQSEHTDPGSLIDIYSTGDILSVRDEDEDTDVDLEETSHPQQDSVIQTPAQTPLAGSTATPAEAEKLTLSEPTDASSTGVIIASKPLNNFSPPFSASWSSPHDHDKLVAEIKMPIGRGLLEELEKRTLRVMLFRPRNLDHLDQAILHKLADAQLASDTASDAHSPPSPSRFHVVPDTFGPGAQPVAAAMVPVDYQLESVYYEHAELGTDGPMSICLGDRDNPRRTRSILERTSSNVNGRYRIVGSQMEDPDIAIVVTDDCKCRDCRHLLQSSLAFTRRHGIPAIALREGWEYDTSHSISIDDVLHLSIRDGSMKHDSAVRTIPVDVDTFLSLNPLQLSRHVRYLIRKGPRKHAGVNSHDKVPAWADADVEKNAHALQSHSRSTFYSSARFEPLVYGFILLMSGVLLMHTLFAFSTRWTQVHDVDSLHEKVTRDTKAIEAGASASLSASNVSKDLAVAMGTPSSALSERPFGQSKKKFEVEVVGNSHLVIRTSREYRVQEQLQVSISREGREISSETRSLFPSVWEVSLDADQAYGDLCIQLSMKRPAINETTIINMGQQPFDMWLRGMLQETECKIQQKLTLLQDSLESLRREQRAQSLMNHIRDKISLGFLQASEMQERAQKVQQAIMSKTQGMSPNTKAWIKDLGRELQRHGQVTVRNSKALIEDSVMAVHRLRIKVDELDVGSRVAALWRKAQKGPQSDVLARAQDRAQHAARELRGRVGRREL